VRTGSNDQTNARRRIFLMRHGSVTYFDDAGKPFLPEQVPLNETAAPRPMPPARPSPPPACASTA
jgi:hypothetical protein